MRGLIRLAEGHGDEDVLAVELYVSAIVMTPVPIGYALTLQSPRRDDIVRGVGDAHSLLE